MNAVSSACGICGLGGYASESLAEEWLTDKCRQCRRSNPVCLSRIFRVHYKSRLPLSGKHREQVPMAHIHAHAFTGHKPRNGICKGCNVSRVGVGSEPVAAAKKPRATGVLWAIAPTPRGHTLRRDAEPNPPVVMACDNRDCITGLDWDGGRQHAHVLPPVVTKAPCVEKIRSRLSCQNPTQGGATGKRIAMYIGHHSSKISASTCSRRACDGSNRGGKRWRRAHLQGTCSRPPAKAGRRIRALSRRPGLCPRGTSAGPTSRQWLDKEIVQSLLLPISLFHTHAHTHTHTHACTQVSTRCGNSLLVGPSKAIVGQSKSISP
jgi:hypothetical protein